MKRQIEKSQILSIYILLTSKYVYIYLRNREKSLTTEFSKGFLLDIREETYTEFIILLLEKSTKPKILT